MIHKRTCNICEALCGVVLEHDGEAVTSVRGNPDDVLSRGHICPKALALKDLHEDPDRLRQPMRRQGDRWIPVAWDSAYDEVASRIEDIQRRYGRSAFAVYAGNPTAHNYASLLANVAFHQVLRTRNRFSATSVDQLPHMFAALQLFGHQLLLPVPDIDRTRYMVLLGANPLVSNGSLMTAPGAKDRLAAIRARGGKVIVIDPRRTETAEIADEHHSITPGTDAMFLGAILHTLFAERLIAGGRWRQYTRGVEQLERAVSPLSPDAVAEHTRISPDTIRRIAREFAHSPSAALYPRLGVCTQRFGGLAAWLALAVNIVTENLDRPGGLMFAQPAVDLVELAAMAGQSGHFAVWRSRVSGRPEFGGELPVATLAEEILTPGDGQIRGLLTFAGNPVLSTPNGPQLASALDSLEFMVSLDMFITATSRHANLIIPPFSPLERDHFGLAFHALNVRNTVKYSEPLFSPPVDARDDWQSMLEIAERLSAMNGKAPEKARSWLLRKLRENRPSSVLDVALRVGRYGALRNPIGPRLTLAKVKRHPDGIDLGALKPMLPDALRTPNKTIDLATPILIADLPRLARAMSQPPASDDLVLIGRRQLRSNNTWLHNSPRLVRGKPRCTLLMHPNDAAARALRSGDSAIIRSKVGAVEATVDVTDGIMPGVVSLPHGWGHLEKGARMTVANQTIGASFNDLTDADEFDPLTGTAVLNGVSVTVSAARSSPAN